MSRRSFVKTLGAGLTAVAGNTQLVRSQTQGAKAQSCPSTQDEIYFDERGFIVQHDCDGGDTAQREGMYWLGNWFRMNAPELKSLGSTSDARRYGKLRPITFIDVMDALEEPGKTGRFRRHPTQTKEIGEGPFRGRMNDPKTTSRDQLMPLIAAMGMYKDYERLDRFRDKLRQGTYFVNKDFLLLSEEFIKRARDVDLLFDGEADRFLLDQGVTMRCNQARGDKNDVGDDLNLIVQLLLAANRRGDKIKSVRARYARERPRNYGIFMSQYRAAFPNDFTAGEKDMIDRMETGIKKGWKPDCTNVVGVFRWYFRAEAGGSPGLAKMYEPILSAYCAAPIS